MRMVAELLISGGVRSRVHIRCWLTGMCIVTSSGLCYSQTTLPLPLTTQTSVDPKLQYEPLTPRQKMDLAVRNTFSIRAILNRAAIAGIDHWRDHPEEWPGGMEGFGMRHGNRMGRVAVRNAVQLAADVAFKTDPRYDRCNCTGFKSRSAHAWKRVILSRTDSGGEMISVSRLAGAYVTPFITDTWYPDRLATFGDKWVGGTQFLAFRGATNMLREFWPEISRKLKFRRK